MDRSEHRPIIYVSRCLGFDACRYNGQVLPNEFVSLLALYVDFRVICPEVEIGLGVPRHPIRLVKQDDRFKLLQYETERDVTSAMLDYTAAIAAKVVDADGFILKSRSPSCGFKDVKVYPGLGKVSALGTDAGLFGGGIVNELPQLAVEDEGRLSNFRIREHFLTRIFASAHWRQIKKTQAMSELVKFQSQYKYLLLAYSERHLRALGKIVANHEKRAVDHVFSDYELNFYEAMSKQPRVSATINALEHVKGHYSRAIKAEERAYLTDSIEMYREERVPLSVPLSLLRAYAIRTEDQYLQDQVFFEPYPTDLTLIRDSGLGRPIK